MKKLFILFCLAIVSITTKAQTITVEGALIVAPGAVIDTANYFIFADPELVVINSGFSVNANIRKASPNDPTRYPFSIQITAGANYDIRMWTNDQSIGVSGISVLDMVLIQRHILGIAPFTSPIRRHQADVTNDGKVTGQDLTELRKFILGITQNLNGNGVGSIITTESVPELQYKLNNVTSNLSGLNFKRIKLGDVSGNSDGF